MWNMMVLTMCNFRIDEYMETKIAKLSDDDLELIKSTIRNLCNAEEPDEPRSRKTQWEDSMESFNRNQHHPAMIEERTNGAERFQNGNGANETDRVISATNGQYSVSPLINFRAVISHYTRVMLTYPRNLAASTTDRTDFRSLLRSFLLSHIAPIADNSRFATQPHKPPSTIPISQNPRTSFYTWAHNNRRRQRLVSLLLHLLQVPAWCSFCTGA